MIKLYDKNMKYITSFTSYKNLKVIESLDTGYKTAQFQAPYTIGKLVEEQKVEINDYLFVIKEVNMTSNDVYDVFCKPYFSDLSKKFVDNLIGYNMNFKNIMDNLLFDTTWSYSGNIVGAFTMDLHNMTLLEALDNVAKLFNCVLFYNTKAKHIEVKPLFPQIAAATSFTLTPDNIGSCKIQSNTYDLITKMIPIGKDMVTINAVNEGQAAIENHQYTDEVIVGYYINTSIYNPDDLLKTAQQKLEEVSRPSVSYKIQCNQLSKVQIGDRVRVIDSIKGVDLILYVREKVSFPLEPGEDYIELGDTPVSFDSIYKDFKKAQDIVMKDTLRSLSILSKKQIESAEKLDNIVNNESGF